jgi:hypothetical protein
MKKKKEEGGIESESEIVLPSDFIPSYFSCDSQVKTSGL